MNNPTTRLIKSSLLYLLIIIVTAAAALGLHAHNFQVFSSDTMDIAQIAHHISDGHGFYTDIIRSTGTNNENLGIKDSAIPELWHAPLYPTLLAGAFFVGGIRDATITGFTVALLVLSAVLLFTLAKRLLGRVSHALAVTLAYSVSVAVLTAVDTRQPPVLGACLLLGLLLVLTPKNEELELAKLAAEPEGRPTRGAARRLAGRYFIIGIWAALCYLNDYASPLYVLPLVFLWSRDTRPITRGSVFTFVVGFFLIAMPWWVRNMKSGGNPFMSQEFLILTEQADDLPGVLVNLQIGLSNFVRGAAAIPHLLLAPFIFLSLWIRPASESLARRKFTVLLASLIAVCGLCALGRGGSEEMVPLAPLLALVGVATFQQLVSNSWFANSVGRNIASPYRFEQSETDDTIFDARVTKRYATWPFFAFKLWLLERLRLPMRLRTVGDEELLYSGNWPMRTLYEIRALAVLVLLLCVPLTWQLLVAFKAKPIDLNSAITPLVKIVPQDHFVITDVPEAVAWYGNRRAWLLPRRAARVLELDDTGVGGIYLADPTVLNRFSDWRPAYERQNIPGYQLMPVKGVGDVYYLKMPSFQEAKQIVQKNPNSAQAYIQLGKAAFAKQQFSAALAAYTTAVRLKPTSVEAIAGAGAANLGLKNNAAAGQQFARALQLAPRAQPVLMGMAALYQSSNQVDQAIATYEKALSDSPNNLIALNNLADLYAEQGKNLYRALELSRRAAQQNQQSGAIWDTLGWTSFRLGYKQEALVYLKQAAKLSPGNPDIARHLAQATAAK